MADIFEYAQHISARSRSQDIPVVKVSAVFGTVNDTSPFDYARVLHEVEKAQRLPPFFMAYCRRSMNAYRKLICEKWDGEEDLSEEAYEVYAKFRFAQTWNDVANSFPQGTKESSGERDFMRYFRRGERVDSDNNERQEHKKAVNARELAKVYDRVEEVIRAVIKSLNEVEKWAAEARTLEKSMLASEVFNFIMEGIRLFRSGFKPSYVDNVYNNLKALGDVESTLPVSVLDPNAE